MKENYPFVKLHDGSNIIRFITQLYQCKSHLHDEKHQICVPFTEFCFLCSSESSVFRTTTNWVAGVTLFSDTKASDQIFRFNTYLYRQLLLYAQNPDYGDPNRYIFDLKTSSNGAKVVAVIVEEIPNYVPCKNPVLEEKCKKLIDPLNDSLAGCMSQNDFKKIYMLCRVSKGAVDYLTELVNLRYPQYADTLKKCLLFS